MVLHWALTLYKSRIISRYTRPYPYKTIKSQSQNQNLPTKPNPFVCPTRQFPLSPPPPPPVASRRQLAEIRFVGNSNTTPSPFLPPHRPSFRFCFSSIIMEKKRKSIATSLDEVDRTMHSTFCTAANCLSQLYSQAMNQQKLSFLSGERHGLVTNLPIISCYMFPDLISFPP